MTWIELGIFGWLWREAAHFVLGFIAGWLVYSLTLTILLRCGLAVRTADSHIYPLPLLVALCFALLLHILEDYTLCWF